MILAKIMMSEALNGVFATHERKVESESNLNSIATNLNSICSVCQGGND